MTFAFISVRQIVHNFDFSVIAEKIGVKIPPRPSIDFDGMITERFVTAAPASDYKVLIFRT